MRLIDADDLVEKHPFIWSMSMKFNLDLAQTIDAAPVVHSQCKKSIERDEWWGYIYTCIECGAEMMVQNAENECVPPEYCAICGAKMDGDPNGDGA